MTIDADTEHLEVLTIADDGTTRTAVLSQGARTAMPIEDPPE